MLWQGLFLSMVARVVVVQRVVGASDELGGQLESVDRPLGRPLGVNPTVAASPPSQQAVRQLVDELVGSNLSPDEKTELDTRSIRGSYVIRLPVASSGLSTTSGSERLLQAVTSLDSSLSTRVFKTTGLDTVVVSGVDDSQLPPIAESVLLLGGTMSRDWVHRLPARVDSRPALAAVSVPSASSIRCESEGCNCCRRSTDHVSQAFLDLLDNTLDDHYCGPLPSSSKTHVFVLDIGIEQSHSAFANVDISVQDCGTNPSPWTPNVDTSGFGTAMAGVIAGNEYGVTPNVALHVIKVVNDNFQFTTSTISCGAAFVTTWLTANPDKLAVVAIPSPAFVANEASFRSVLAGFAGNARVVLVLPAYPGNCFTVTDDNVPRVIFVGRTDRNRQQGSGNICTHVFAATQPVMIPYLGNSIILFIDNSNYFASAAVAGVLAEYSSKHPYLSATQLADLILDSNGTSPLYFDGVVTGIPVGSTLIKNRLIKSICSGGCEPCQNGGFCLPKTSDLLQCYCQRHTAGEQCEKVVCDGSECIFGHPSHCDQYVVCKGEQVFSARCPLGCNGEKQLFDIVTQECRPRCESHVQPGCNG